MSPRNDRDLRVWQAAVDLSFQIWEMTRCLPRHEAFGLAAQLRPAAVSVAANIAEGQARSSAGNFLRFPWIARGSLAEIDSHVAIAAKLGHVNEEQVARLASQLDMVARMLRRLQQALSRHVPESSR